MMPAPKSACCDAPIRISQAGEGTSFYRCTACGEPVDVLSTNAAPPEEVQDRPSLGQDPAGHWCSACGRREATAVWGDWMTVNHGGGEWRCDICALTEQLEFAHARAAAIPTLKAKLAEAVAKDAAEWEPRA